MRRLVKSEKEWRDVLTPLQFEVCRKKGTERAFTGKYYDTKTQGTYVCSCCSTPLFLSSTKFDSGTGWPSFYAPIDDDVITRHEDTTLGVPRTEVVCAVCDAHLGHVFDDGPHPTGLRYCINSICLELKEDD